VWKRVPFQQCARKLARLGMNDRLLIMDTVYTQMHTNYRRVATALTRPNVTVIQPNYITVTNRLPMLEVSNNYQGGRIT